MNPTSPQYNSTDLEEQRAGWIWYLTRHRTDPTLTESDLHRLSLAEYCYHLQQDDGYHLYHLSLTYKPNPDYTLRIKDVNKFFINFHIKYLLPLLLGTKNIHFMHHRNLQPKVLSFLDEHLHDKFTTVGEPARLHHHAIYAVNPSNKAIMDHYIGENMFDIVGGSAMPYKTCDLKPCEPMRVLYASKMYEKYPDFLSFPDKMNRSRCKHRMTEHVKASDKKIISVFRKFTNKMPFCE
jgi:hypothetical protein